MAIRLESLLCFDLEFTGLLVGYFELVICTLVSIWMLVKVPNIFPYEYSIPFAVLYIVSSIVWIYGAHFRKWFLLLPGLIVSAILSGAFVVFLVLQPFIVFYCCLILVQYVFGDDKSANSVGYQLVIVIIFAIVLIPIGLCWYLSIAKYLVFKHIRSMSKRTGQDTEYNVVAMQ